ncbi:hypothetical protein DEH18_28120 [Streptomyces sp. NHF165]|nr:hypothetical protein DEH18_28120 [Streptomyces sp. NHF165]
MGRHSRRGKPATGSAETREDPGIPGTQPTGRERTRQRPAVRPRDGAAGPDTGAGHGAPVPPLGHGVPPHSAGAPAGAPPHGAPVRGGHPEPPEAVGAPPFAAGPPVGQAGPGRRRRGPRQEYLDAFEDGPQSAGAAGAAAGDDDVFAAGAPGARRPGGPGAPDSAASGMPGQRGGPPAPPAADPGPSDAVPAGPAGPPGGEPPAPLAPIAPPPPRRNRGRTYTGLAAAAVTTALAVVVAGQVAGGEDGSAGDQAGAGTESRQVAGRGADAGDGKVPEKPTAPQSYNAKMARQYPLSADSRGTGRFTAVPGHEAGPRDAARTLRYRIDVEKGLPLDGGLFAQAVHKTLNDKRSWAHGGERGFERVSSGKPDFVITLASPHTTDVWCAKSGLDTSEEKVSCDSAATERVMINAYRWARGAQTYGSGQMHAYRQMLINHEVGHRLGHGHVGCPGDGKLAPVMMQQTKYLTTGRSTCRPNAWPYPKG